VSDVETAFEQVIGRQPSDAERQRLYKLRDSLGLRENDAFWFIVMALEQYDALFREYPRQLAEETARTIEGARATFAAAAQGEAAHVQQVLSQKVAETSVQIARKLSERPLALHRVTMVLAAVVAFGALCVNTGYNLATSARPFWASPERFSGVQRVLSLVFAVPAGWMLFVFALPGAWHTGSVGWALARDQEGGPRERVLGWTITTVCAVSCVALAIMIAKLT
jgi:hypothetical protein